MFLGVCIAGLSTPHPLGNASQCLPWNSQISSPFEHSPGCGAGTRISIISAPPPSQPRGQAQKPRDHFTRRDHAGPSLISGNLSLHQPSLSHAHLLLTVAVFPLERGLKHATRAHSSEKQGRAGGRAQGIAGRWRNTRRGTDACPRKKTGGDYSESPAVSLTSTSHLDEARPRREGDART